jgi:hypothetical protein
MRGDAQNLGSIRQRGRCQSLVKISADKMIQAAYADAIFLRSNFVLSLIAGHWPTEGGILIKKVRPEIALSERGSVRSLGRRT